MSIIQIEDYKLFGIIEKVINDAIPNVIETVTKIKSKLDEAPDYVTQSGASRIIEVSPTQIKSLIDNGHISPKYMKPNNRIMIPKTELTKILSNKIYKECLKKSMNGLS